MVLFLGILILIVPFFFIFFFENRLRAFSYVFVLSTLFSLCVSLVTQFFEVFNYPVVISIYSLVVLGMLGLLFFLRKRKKNFRVDVFLIAALSIISFELISVHYSYTGEVTTITGVTHVKDSTYSYPMYSDEWIAAGFAKKTIQTNSLPIMHPLNPSEPVLNILAPFHSLLAMFFLISGLDPVSQFSIAVILSGFFICIVSYVLLRSMGVSTFVSSLVILCIPFVAQSGSLPGVWFLIPSTFSLSFFLLYLASLFHGDERLIYITAFLALIFYPPMIVFVVPAYLGYLFTQKDSENRIKTSFRFFVIVLGTGLLSLLVLSSVFDFKKAIIHALSLLVRPNLDGGILRFPVWAIVPVILIPFALLGMVSLYKKRAYTILTPLVFGLVYWSFYAFYPAVIIIEYPRVVFITSYLISTVSGLGISACVMYVHKFIRCKKYQKTFIKWGILLFFGCFAFVYPVQSNWQDFTLEPFDREISSPVYLSHAIKHHLTPEDIRIFETIKNQRFISPEWKGLVLGVATDNFPLDSKYSTFANKILQYEDFMKSTCFEKTEYSKKYGISYVYSSSFDCPGFVLIETSSEKLRLYKVY